MWGFTFQNGTQASQLSHVVHNHKCAGHFFQAWKSDLSSRLGCLHSSFVHTLLCPDLLPSFDVLQSIQLNSAHRTDKPKGCHEAGRPTFCIAVPTSRWENKVRRLWWSFAGSSKYLAIGECPIEKCRSRHSQTSPTHPRGASLELPSGHSSKWYCFTVGGCTKYQVYMLCCLCYQTVKGSSC